MERLELSLRRLRLPRAVLRREPYFVALAVPQFGNAADVRTVPFPRVNRAHDLVFDPPFVVLGVDDPGSRVAISIAIMESDAGFRAAGARLDAMLETLKRGSVGHLIGKAGAVSNVGAALKVAGGLVAAVARFLSKNGDDHLGTLELVVDVPLVANAITGRFSSSFAELDYAISISRSSALPADAAAHVLTEATPSTVEPLSLEEISSAVRIGEDLRAQEAAIAKTFGIPAHLLAPASDLVVKPAAETDFANLSDAEIDARAEVEVSDEELERLTAPDAPDAPAAPDAVVAPAPARRGLFGRK